MYMAYTMYILSESVSLSDSIFLVYSVNYYNVIDQLFAVLLNFCNGHTNWVSQVC